MDPEHPRDGGGGGGDEMGLQNPPAPPRLCANNCGFFGSPATNNLCSKCYRKVYIVQADNNNNTSQGKQPAAAVAAPVEAFNPIIIHQAGGDVAAAPSANELSTGISSSSSSSSSSSPPLAATTTTGAKPKPNRCGCCRKKVGLMGFWCRCGGVFCPVHRYSDKHACAFDYKAAAQDAIARANPVLKPDKLDKI